MVDEVTDNRTIKHMAICTRFIGNNRDIKASFLTNTELKSATADSITQTINTELKKNQLNSKDMAGFASDGAADFIGTTFLKYTYIFSIFLPFLSFINIATLIILD